MSDYLFDKQGEPDPEIARLERLLAPMAYRGGRPTVSPLPAPARRRRVVVFAVGALGLAVLLAFLWLRPGARGWEARTLAGAPTVEGHALASRLAVGAWLETGAGRALLRVGGLGTVELAPGTRARIVETGAAQERLELSRGGLSARIGAPPRRFVVETPRARVIDLGCAFELTVDDAGAGRLVVTEGRVALAGAGREVVVPAGARCELTAGGPGVPEPIAPTPSAPQPTAPTPSPAAPAPSSVVPAPSPAAPAPSPGAPKRSKPPVHRQVHNNAPPQTQMHNSAPPRTQMHNSAPAEAHDAHAPTKKVPPPPDRTRLSHDPLRDLERSVP